MLTARQAPMPLGLQDSRVVLDLGYANEFVLLVTTAMGLQRLLDAVAILYTIWSSAY